MTWQSRARVSWLPADRGPHSHKAMIVPPFLATAQIIAMYRRPPSSSITVRAEEPGNPIPIDNPPQPVAPGTLDAPPKPVAPGTADNPVKNPDMPKRVTQEPPPRGM